ncbi:hypothetical protein [Actinoplanes sp. ATCC 53533]|nr:hypothetical protein [Actinoplanes sp. ATCC 53533]
MGGIGALEVVDVDAVARAAVPAQSSGVDVTDDGGSAAGTAVRAPAAG